jgi:hypothetical protein
LTSENRSRPGQKTAPWGRRVVHLASGQDLQLEPRVHAMLHYARGACSRLSLDTANVNAKPKQSLEYEIQKTHITKRVDAKWHMTKRRRTFHSVPIMYACQHCITLRTGMAYPIRHILTLEKSIFAAAPALVVAYLPQDFECAAKRHTLVFLAR